jgi:hypothetical protein
MHEILDPDLLSRIARERHSASILERLTRYELTRPDRGLHDEEVWTLLFAYGFVVVEGGLTKLAQLLIEGTVPPTRFNVQLEMLPFPPRQGLETNSNIDLVAGHWQIRGRTQTGIDYHTPDERPGWVCMTEVKWLSDIAMKTTHDLQRNQLARVIETALTFQQPGNPPSYPEAIHVTLLTPDRFKPPRESITGSRFYFYKYNEYWHADRPQIREILGDIDNAQVPRRNNTPEWEYPELERRIGSLRLHWVTFEGLLAGMPHSEYKQHLSDFLGHEPRKMLRL